ncbi:hypothetical protein SASPL_154372 [Salvia splendens]|uniref:C2H2-type domain-containing protein n=1 Tax=Salvia splendens TaxID=180675 RepID=A0A8X8W004_SALSN|nr:uncharacterized protein LOC121786274 [Salvia splendens]KAG6385536.1 hypothetical protein SASPL_154372 [Salvia splendens]
MFDDKGPIAILIVFTSTTFFRVNSTDHSLLLSDKKIKQEEDSQTDSMPRAWFCKSNSSDVYDPVKKKLQSRSSRSGCSRSIANLKDVIHGSKRHPEPPPPASSPRSIGSSEFLNPIAHHVVFSTSKHDLKFSGFSQDTRKNVLTSQTRNNDAAGAATCHKCGQHFVKLEYLESHHLSSHAVTELVEGDSSRKVVEIICRSTKSEPSRSVRIQRVLKVHNMPKTVCRFEDYREMVKIKASKLPKKHPRCLADGNELLRFYGTHAACALGVGSSALCVSDKCSVCRIIRHGFSAKREVRNGVGVFTASTSGRAFESIEDDVDDDPSLRKALIVCRVIAGRVHRPLDNVLDIVGQTGFDSLAGKVGLYSNVEELYLLNPKALLPCFVIICKT